MYNCENRPHLFISPNIKLCLILMSFKNVKDIILTKCPMFEYLVKHCPQIFRRLSKNYSGLKCAWEVCLLDHTYNVTLT